MCVCVCVCVCVWGGGGGGAEAVEVWGGVHLGGGKGWRESDFFCNYRVGGRGGAEAVEVWGGVHLGGGKGWRESDFFCNYRVRSDIHNPWTSHYGEWGGGANILSFYQHIGCGVRIFPSVFKNKTKIKKINK